jgi:hypothetical protein
MHTVTFQARFAFGDRVRFDSKMQGCSGVGKIFAITIDLSGHFDYMIEIDGSHVIQPGIQEGEIVLLSSDGELDR